MTRLTVHRILIGGSRQKTLLKEGWALQEVKKLLSGLKASRGSMTEATFWAMRKSRVQWYNDRVRDGWTRGQIMATIRRHYKNLDKYDPWKEYRAQYAGYPGGDYDTPHPFRGNNFPTNYRAAAQRRAVQDAKSLYKPRKPIDITIKGERIRF